MNLDYDYPEQTPSDNHLVLTYCPDYTPLEYFICKVIDGKMITHDEVDISEYVEYWSFISSI